MITIVTRWETSQMPPDLEWRMWRQLRGAFKFDRVVFVPRLPKMDGYTFDQYDTVEEALENCEGERVFLEPSGYNALSAIPTGDIVMILGNTQMHNMAHAKVNETFKIYTPGATDLYGINAAAIALAVRYGQ